MTSLSATDIRDLIIMGVAIALCIAWYLTYAAARLDRLHTKVEGAMSALDAQLVRRAEASIELANSGVLDPASAFLLGEAAANAAERHTEHPLSDDLLDGQHFAGREEVESELTWALDAAIDPLLVTDDAGAETVARVEAAAVRVQMARRFHNDAVAEVRRVRNKRVVRWLHLAGHAALPEPVVFDDELPRALRP